MDAVSAQNLSDTKMAAATGKVFAEWHAILDAAGAREWKHPAIAAWLQAEYSVDGWWSQGITVAFEQAIGRRLPGQTADGTFSVTASKTFDAPREALLDKVLAALTEQLGASESVNPDSIYSTARWKAGSETTVASISESKTSKTVVVLTRSRIVDGESLGVAKAELREILDSLTSSGDLS